MSSASDPITVLLEQVRQGSGEAKQGLVALLYEQFRERAHRQLRHERRDHSLTTTALTHEAVQRLWNDELARAGNRHQLFRAFARAMRQLLIDHARRKKAEKRGGGLQRVELDDVVEEVCQNSHTDARSLGDLDEALEALAKDQPRHAEIVELRFFGRMKMEEIAEALGVSLSDVERKCRFAIAWLRVFLSPKGDS